MIFRLRIDALAFIIYYTSSELKVDDG